MIKVTPQIALLVFGIILVISALVAVMMKNYKSFDSGGFHTFIVILGGLGVFVTFMFYFSIVSLQQQQQDLNIIHETARFSDSMLDLMINEMNDASVNIPHFVLSLNPLAKRSCKKCDVEEDEDNTTNCLTKTFLSYKIFSMWQEAIVTSNFITHDRPSLVANFLQRANSKQLHEQWLLARVNFDCKTKNFGDLLFEYGLKITKQCPEVYMKQARLIIEDERYKDTICDCCH